VERRAREVQLSLTPIFGEVTVMAEPASAEVFANGRAIGKSGRPSSCQPHAPTSKYDWQDSALIERQSAAPAAAGAERAARSGQVATLRRQPRLPQRRAVQPPQVPPVATARPLIVESLTPTIRTKSGAELRLLGPASFTMAVRAANRSPRQ